MISQVDKFQFVELFRRNDTERAGRNEAHCTEHALPKGGWHGEAVTEGLCGRHLFYCKTYAKSYYGNNPSVSFADSSLKTRSLGRPRAS